MDFRAGEEEGLEGLDADSKVNSKVQAVVNFFGPTDLNAEDLPIISVPLRNDFIGGTPEEKPSETTASEYGPGGICWKT